MTDEFIPQIVEGRKQLRPNTRDLLQEKSMTDDFVAHLEKDGELFWTSLDIIVFIPAFSHWPDNWSSLESFNSKKLASTVCI